jgi:D-methionine transport system substrate-binding protein
MKISLYPLIQIKINMKEIFSMKKALTILLATILVVAALAGCGSTTASSAVESSTSEDASTPTELTTITVGASSTPHAEILEVVKDALAEEGYDLNIVVYDDYVLPNQALADGTLDANYFQHTPYLVSFNASNGTDLVAAASIHYEPFGIYGNGIDNLADLADGATIIIPADDSNETRALLLLQQEGLITLPEDASASKGVTTLDIVDNGGYNIVPVQADTVPAQFNNSDAGTIAVINGNYALAAGLNASEALAIEDASGDAAQTYANIIAVRNGDENNEKTVALVKALQSDAVKTFIEETYNGAVVAIF